MTPFELNLKSEPGMNTSVTLSSLCNLAQIPGLDILSKCESPVSVDSLLTHHCTILPPEIVSDEGILQPGLRTANFVATGQGAFVIWSKQYAAVEGISKILNLKCALKIPSTV